MDFEHIKKYLYTIVKEPGEIPEERRDFLHQKYQSLLAIERTHLPKTWAEKMVCPLVFFHTIFGVVLAIGLEVSFNEFLYIAGFILFILWVLITVPYLFMGIRIPFRRFPAQRIYVETERMVQERQRGLLIALTSRNLV